MTDYRSPPLTGPLYVYTEMPTDVEEIKEVILGELNGKGLSQLPQFYKPYAEHRAAARAAKPIAQLRKLNPNRTTSRRQRTPQRES